MTSMLSRPPDTDGATPACDCPEITHRGSIQDRITTIHRPLCTYTTSLHLGAPARVESTRYAPGTLDQLLDDTFGPVTR